MTKHQHMMIKINKFMAIIHKLKTMMMMLCFKLPIFVLLSGSWWREIKGRSSLLVTSTIMDG